MRPQAIVRPLPKQPTVPVLAMAPQRFTVGMDGIRRPVPASPRDALSRMHAPEPILEAAPALAATAPTPVWNMPSLRLPHVEWKRPAVAFGLVATALIASGVTVTSMSSQQPPAARASTEKAAPAAPAAAVVAPTPAPEQVGLQQLLDNFAAAHPGKFSIVVKDLNTGVTASVDSEKQMTSASLYKLFVAKRIYQQIDLGQLTHGQAAGGGSGRNIESCLAVMINVSDNTCGRALGSILNWGAQDHALEIEGYNQTSLRTIQKTSAADVATLMSRLYNGTLLSSNSSTRFMELLKDQRVNNRLPVGLPAGTTIAHKTGDLHGYMHDAGIVYGPKTNYLVVVMGAPGSAPAQFADLSQQLWNHFEN